MNVVYKKKEAEALIFSGMSAQFVKILCSVVAEEIMMT